MWVDKSSHGVTNRMDWARQGHTMVTQIIVCTKDAFKPGPDDLLFTVVTSDIGMHNEPFGEANDIKVARRMDRDEIMDRMKVANIRKTFRAGIKVRTLEAFVTCALNV